MKLDIFLNAKEFVTIPYSVYSSQLKVHYKLQWCRTRTLLKHCCGQWSL